MTEGRMDAEGAVEQWTAEGEGVAAETPEVAGVEDVAVGSGVPTLLGSCDGAALIVRSLP